MARRIVLTDYAWSDTDIERGVLEAAGFELVSGPAIAGTASDVEALVAAHDLLGAGVRRRRPIPVRPEDHRAAGRRS